VWVESGDVDQDWVLGAVWEELCSCFFAIVWFDLLSSDVLGFAVEGVVDDMEFVWAESFGEGDVFGSVAVEEEAVGEIEEGVSNDSFESGVFSDPAVGPEEDSFASEFAEYSGEPCGGVVGVS